jgi:hypothetical protein
MGAAVALRRADPYSPGFYPARSGPAAGSNGFSGDCRNFLNVKGSRCEASIKVTALLSL